MFLLDTNVLSEIIKRHPNAGMLSRLFSQRPDDLFASAITRFELRFGACLRPDGDRLWKRLQHQVLPIVNWLALDEQVTARAGEIAAALRRNGRQAGTVDALLAATADVHDLTLVTRNVRHFATVADLRIENWFDG